MHKLLIVDDEAAIRSSLSFALENDYHIFTAASEQQALDLLARKDFDIVLLDLRLGKSDGLELLAKIKADDHNALIIIMTAYGSIKSSVEAMRAGAFHYITKPINMDELAMLLNTAGEFIRLKTKVRYLNEKLSEIYEVSGIIGQSPRMRDIVAQIDKLKDIDTNILITGESGTGKEIVAKALHYSSRRRHEAFEVVNCAAIPLDLLESELFGHEKGAFTGALQRKPGAFERSNGGTIFLDEIGEMDTRLQAKLLRVVQDKEVAPLGSGQRRRIDVRIICATNRDLKQLIGEGKFREDLYFRLNVVAIHMPPLRDRIGDIPPLVDYFIGKYNRKMGKSVRGIDETALASLLAYRFRGNVRELENIIERAIVFAESDTITLDDLTAEVRQAVGAGAGEDGNLVVSACVGETIRAVERKLILKTLAHCRGDKQRTAAMLQISERKLWYKLKEYEAGKSPDYAGE